jgi:hypothetical protein
VVDNDHVPLVAASSLGIYFYIHYTKDFMAKRLRQLKRCPTLLLVIKSGAHLWGRSFVKGKVIVSVGRNMQELQKITHKMILDFEEVEVESFEIAF